MYGICDRVYKTYEVVTRLPLVNIEILKKANKFDLNLMLIRSMVLDAIS